MGLALTLWLAGCASGPSEVQRLQARSTYERGLNHLQERQVSLGMSSIQEAIALDPTNPVYRNSLGVVYMQLRRPDRALEQFIHATELDPNYAEAFVNTGSALAEMRRWDEAVVAYRQALALPTLPVPHIAYQNMGLALYHLKQYREAEEALRFAIGLDSQMEGGYYNLGLVLLAQYRREEAKAAFRRARDLAPQSDFGRAAKGQLKALGEGS
ncbi:MAG TPA: tetratricopeptide repeat protein [Methylomirabilota bacterium]|jgi:Tfp pilus assembly protein PilF